MQQLPFRRFTHESQISLLHSKKLKTMTTRDLQRLTGCFEEKKADGGELHELKDAILTHDDVDWNTSDEVTTWLKEHVVKGSRWENELEPCMHELEQFGECSAENQQSEQSEPDTPATFGIGDLVKIVKEGSMHGRRATVTVSSACGHAAAAC